MNPRGAAFAAACFGLVLAGIAPASERNFEREKNEMVEHHLKLRGILDPRVLAAMQKVPRHLFVDPGWENAAYADTPLPIARGQTISQPYVVAFMSEAARIGPEDRVLEIGTGSGYQAAILAELAQEVYTIELEEELARTAAERLKQLGVANVQVRHGDGYEGWPEKAPFDAIVVTAAPPEIPQALIDQLRAGGRMVIPVGSSFQSIFLVTKTPTGIQKQKLIPVRFVPMREAES